MSDHELKFEKLCGEMRKSLTGKHVLIFAESVRALIEMNAMIAENEQRKICDQSMAWSGDCFLTLEKQFTDNIERIKKS